jgi:rhodanese-related sulfurtransferase
MMDIPQLNPSELKTEHNYLILDVRETHEWEFVHLPGSVHVPLRQLSTRHCEFPRNRKILCLCHHGMRSQRAAEFLKQKGFDQVLNLQGGIDRCSLELDSTLPRY